jgi:methyltransferase (TIGR00027 family)
VYEVDQPKMQAWKRERLDALGLPRDQLAMVPLDFEADDAWLDALTDAGFDRAAPAVVAALGVTMYLTRTATTGLLRQAAALAPGSRLVLTVAVPAHLVEPEERALLAQVERGALASGHPWISHYAPVEIGTLALEAGLHDPQTSDAGELTRRYFGSRADGLRPSSIEAVLTARTG